MLCTKGYRGRRKLVEVTIYKHYTILHDEKLQAHWYTTITV